MSFPASQGTLRPQCVPSNRVVKQATTARLILVGKPLPRVEDSLRIGELMRMAVMSQAKRLFGDGDIPPVFCGHDMPEDNRHRHAFYLPWDSNGDGRLDRITLHVPDGMDAKQQRILEKLNRIWTRDGSEWRVALESMGGIEVADRLTQKSTVWQSITPYLHPWHVKKRFGIQDQIRRECRVRALPEPVVIEPLEAVNVGKNRKRRPIHFQRFRSKPGLTQPDRHGSFWRLTFPEPIAGPLALGFACHFGMGLFAASAPLPGFKPESI